MSLSQQHAQQGSVVSSVPLGSGDSFFYALQLPLSLGELAVVDELEVSGYEGFWYGHGLSSSAFVFVCFFYAVLGDFEDSFAVGEVGAADEAGYACGSSGGFS